MEKLTVKETARRFGVSGTAVRYWLKDGLKSYVEKIIGIKARIIIDPRDVIEYQASKAVKK